MRAYRDLPKTLSPEKETSLHGQSGKGDGASEEDTEADQDGVGGSLDQTVDDTKTDVSPSQVDGEIVADTHGIESEGGREELGGLLHQVVVVLGLPRNLRWDLLGHGLLALLGRSVDLILAQSRETGRVHPGLHDEGPGAETDDGAQEGLRANGDDRHCCGGGKVGGRVIWDVMGWRRESCDEGETDVKCKQFCS